MAPWGYKTHNGPSTWCNDFPVALGSRQSPVALCASSASPSSSWSPLRIDYSGLKAVRMDNTGASWKIDFEGSSTSYTGGFLKDVYEAVQMHAHWGNDDEHGSEHTLDGKMYPAEVHIVHRNKKYDDMAVCLEKGDGLAVLGFFLQVGESKHEAFDKIVVEKLEEIRLKGNVIDYKDQFDLTTLLPNNLDNFYYYEGSLTTPPLAECVQWTVLQQPLNISEEQLRAMRNLSCSDADPEDKLVDNYRPVCNLNGRKVLRSFE